MPDDRESLGQVAYRKWIEWAIEQPLYFCQTPWDQLGDESREVYERMASAVAMRAVADAKVDAERMRALLFAVGVHVPAALDALAAQIANAEWESQKARFRDAEAVLRLVRGTGEKP